MHQNDDLDGSERLYRQVLAIDHNNPDALHLLGMLIRRKGDLLQGIALMRRAISQQADFPAAHHNLGNALADAGQSSEALACFRRALQLVPDFTGCWRSLARLLLTMGDGLAALDAYDALARYGATPDELLNYAVLLKQHGRNDAALVQCDRVIALAPGTAKAYRLRGGIHSETASMQAEAVADLREALRLAPGDDEIQFALGVLLQRTGDFAGSCACYEAVLARNSHHWAARYLLCLGQLRRIYRSSAEIEESRRHYASHLGRLHDMVMRAGEPDLVLAANAFGQQTPFLLPYQGHNDLPLQRTWGRMICHAMSARYPQAAERPVMPPLHGKLRIGFLSAFLCRHSNWKVPVKGWATELDRARFHTIAYFVGDHRDDVTEEARRCFACFVADLPSLDHWVERIRSDRLHVLIIPEIGMDTLTVQLAGLHLAPVQIGSWGHPVTSGMPTMDYFLSSDAMEPDNAQQWYSERLIRLPGLSTTLYASPEPERPLDLAPFGIGPDTVSYLCVQNLSKYSPAYDHIFPTIARGVEQARFVFLAADAPHIAVLLRDRLRHAFVREGLEPDAHVVFVPRLLARQFVSLNRQADIYLDSVGWSGCNTTIETLQFGTPIVTMAGDSMRARHGSAILAQLGRSDLLPGSVAEYIELAVRLGRDPVYRAAVREDLRRRASRLYNDTTPVRALEAFLHQVVDAHRHGRTCACDPLRHAREGANVQDDIAASRPS